MTKKSRQKFKYLENEKSFSDAFFSSFLRAFIEANKTIFLDCRGPTLKSAAETLENSVK